MLLCISKTVSVIVQQLAPNRESIKLLDPAGRLADTPAEKHIEFQPALAAEPNQRRNIQRFEKSHHRVRHVHPKVKRRRTGGHFGVDHSGFHSARSNPVRAGKPSADRADGDKHGDSRCFPLSFIVRYTTFCIARSLRRDCFAPYRKQTYVTAGKQSRHIRRNAASLSFHSMISRDSYPPRRVCPYSHILCSPSIPESCNHCTEAHILTRS